MKQVPIWEKSNLTLEEMECVTGTYQLTHFVSADTSP